jgi:biotin carboxylase
MTLSRSVLLTNNLYDYALAISAHRQLAQQRGSNSCYPLLLSADQAALIEPLLTYYGITQVNFAGLFKCENTVQRSQKIERSLFDQTAMPIKISSSAAPAQLAQALTISLKEKAPLVFVDSSDSEFERINNGKAIGRPDHLVIAHSRSPLAVGAVYYAHAADKQYCLMENLNHLESALNNRDVSSVTLVDDFRNFDKGFLERLLCWSLETRPTPIQLGILTAYSANEFSALIGRLLIHRDFHLSGRRSAEPEGLERLSLKSMKPVEYYIINEHGNEMHMHHGHDEVICGAFSREFKRAGSPAFDCEVNCPHGGRIRSSEIPAHNVIILSCNTLTFGDGLVPAEYTVLLNFLNGWSGSVIAPFKHVQVNSGMAILVDALIRSGYSLGEINQRLNSVTQFGTLPDYAYVLLGDPEVVPGAGERPSYSDITVNGNGASVHVQSSPHGTRVMECLIPQETIAHVLGNGHPLAFDPVSAELCKTDVFFAFRNLEAARQLGVIVFSTRTLPDSALSFRLQAAGGLRDADKRRVLECVRKISELSILGLDESILQTAKDGLLQPLRGLAAYPRTLELSLGDAAARNFEILLDSGLWQGRRLIVENILTELATRRFWLNQKYAFAYPLQYRLPSQGANGTCPSCNRNIYTWRFEDNCTDLSARDMVICARCGIISDHPAAPEIEIHLQPFRELASARHEQQIVLKNLSNRKIELTFFVQFNQWKRLGSSVEPLIQEVSLEPGETVKTEAIFLFDGLLPNDILEIQGCFLTDCFDLYCVTQRGISSQGGAYRNMTKHQPNGTSHAHAEHHAPQAEHHAPQMESAATLPHRLHEPGMSAHSRESHHGFSKETVTSTNELSDFLVIVEPHAALYRYLEVAQQNYRALVLSSNPGSTLRGEAKYNRSMTRSETSHIDRIIECDTGSSAAMLEALQPFQKQIAGILAGEDSFVPVCAELGGALGFNYTDASDSICLHLKTAMKQRFAERGVRTPRFVVARTLDEAIAGWEQFNRNCMIKMVDSASSMNIYQVLTRPDLEEAWDTIVHNRKKVVTPIPLSQEVLIEEFVEGRELSAEGYIQDDEVVILNFCEKVTESNFVVVGHYLPAEVSAREEDLMRTIVEECVRAVGLRNSVFHVEVHIKDDVPYVIECAGRPPGQHMVELMRRCYGFDLMQISIDLATGTKVGEVPRTPQRHFAMLALYSKETGILQKIDGLEDIHTKGAASHVHLDVKEGDRIQALSTFSDKCGFVILEETSANRIRERAAWVKDNIRFVISD